MVLSQLYFAVGLTRRGLKAELLRGRGIKSTLVSNLREPSSQALPLHHIIQCLKFPPPIEEVSRGFKQFLYGYHFELRPCVVFYASRSRDICSTLHQYEA